MNSFDKHLPKLTIVLLALMFIGQCYNGRSISSLSKENKKTNNKLDSVMTLIESKPSLEKIDDRVVHNLYDFLIYEDDLDHGKTSLSEIKNKAKVK